jgi:hypothetical protein
MHPIPVRMYVQYIFQDMQTYIQVKKAPWAYIVNHIGQGAGHYDVCMYGGFTVWSMPVYVYIHTRDTYMHYIIFILY